MASLICKAPYSKSRKGLYHAPGMTEFQSLTYMHIYIESCILRSIMRTTLDLPEDLLNEAMRVSRIETKTKVIVTALQELVRRNRISELKHYKGKVHLDMDMDTIRSRK